MHPRLTEGENIGGGTPIAGSSSQETSSGHVANCKHTAIIAILECGRGGGRRTEQSLRLQDAPACQ